VSFGILVAATAAVALLLLASPALLVVAVAATVSAPAGSPRRALREGAVAVTALGTVGVAALFGQEIGWNVSGVAEEARTGVRWSALLVGAGVGVLWICVVGLAGRAGWLGRVPVPALLGSE